MVICLDLEGAVKWLSAGNFFLIGSIPFQKYRGSAPKPRRNACSFADSNISKVMRSTHIEAVPGRWIIPSCGDDQVMRRSS